MHPAQSRDGYTVFVKCTDLDASTPAKEFAATIDILDAILHKHIRQEDGDFFSSPFGRAIYREQVLPAMEAAREVIQALGRSSIPAARGAASGEPST